MNRHEYEDQKLSDKHPFTVQQFSEEFSAILVIGDNLVFLYCPHTRHWETAVTNFCNFFTKTTTPENSSRRILCSFVPSQDLKSRFVTICDKIGILHVHVFCGKSVGVTNYFSSLLTNGFTAAVVTIGELAKGKGLLVMRSWV